MLLLNFDNIPSYYLKSSKCSHQSCNNFLDNKNIKITSNTLNCNGKIYVQNCIFDYGNYLLEDIIGDITEFDKIKHSIKIMDDVFNVNCYVNKIINKNGETIIEIICDVIEFDVKFYNYFDEKKYEEIDIENLLRKLILNYQSYMKNQKVYNENIVSKHVSQFGDDEKVGLVSLDDDNVQNEIYNFFINNESVQMWINIKKLFCTEPLFSEFSCFNEMLKFFPFYLPKTCSFNDKDIKQVAIFYGIVNNDKYFVRYINKQDFDIIFNDENKKQTLFKSMSEEVKSYI